MQRQPITNFLLVTRESAEMIQTIYVWARRPGSPGVAGRSARVGDSSRPCQPCSTRGAPATLPTLLHAGSSARRRRRGTSISSWTSVSPTLRILTLSTHPSSSSPHSLSFPSSIHISLAMLLSVSSCPLRSLPPYLHLPSLSYIRY